MPSRSIDAIILIHHVEAAKIANKTARCWRGDEGFDWIRELKKVGNKFTTRVEKRLRKLETGGR